MTVVQKVESAAETVIAVGETIAGAAEVMDEVAESGRRLVKRIIIGVIVLTVVAGVVKAISTRCQLPVVEGEAHP